MRLLVAIPYRTMLHPVLRRRMDALAAALPLDNAVDGWRVDVACYPNAETRGEDEDPYAPHARARNALLAAHLRPEHDAVLWLDADLTYYPPLLPRLLAAQQPLGGIVAPQVLIEQTDRWYDVYGFRGLAGQPFAPERPYYPGVPTYDERLRCEVASVGSCYLAPAALYRAGALYAPTDGHTEHWSVMQACRRTGGRIVVAPGLKVYHAALPAYGEAYHQGHGRRIEVTACSA